jgi:hypothetical protein
MATSFNVAPAAAGTFDTSDWNSYVRDNLKALAYRPTVRVWDPGSSMKTNQTVTSTSAAWTDVTWWQATWDPDNMHVTGTGNEARLTIPANTPTPGQWLVTTTITFEKGSSDGVRSVRIIDDAGAVFGQMTAVPAHSGSRVSVSCIALVEASPADWIKIQVLQDSGISLALVAGNDDEELSCSACATLLGSTTSDSGAMLFEGWGSSSNVADWWDTEIVGSFTRLWRRPGARASRSSGSPISATTGTWTTLTLPTEEWDTEAIHSTVTNTERMTIPRRGLWLIVGQGIWSDGGTAVGTARSCRLRIDGTDYGLWGQMRPSLSIGSRVQVAYVLQLTAGQYVDMQTFHDYGSSIDMWGWLAAVWLGKDEDGGPASGAQRLDEGWQVEPYTAPTTYDYVPRSWVDIHSRDMPGILYAPPAVVLKSQGSHELAPGKWETVRWNRQDEDTWGVIAGRRNAGEKFVLPCDGQWLVGLNANIKDLAYDAVTFAADTKTFTVNTGTDVATATGHGFKTGTEVTVYSSTTIPAGLTVGRKYYVRRIDADTFTFHPTPYDAEDDSNIIDLTTTGSGTHRVSRSILTSSGLNLRTGVRVQVATTTTLPNGLAASTNYWIIRRGKDRYRLAATEDDAYAGIYILVNDQGTGTHTVIVKEPFGSRGVRVVHNGEVQFGWQLGPCENGYQTAGPTLGLVAGYADDEITVEALTRAPEGSRLTMALPTSRWWAVWWAPLEYPTVAHIAPRMHERDL